MKRAGYFRPGLVAALLAGKCLIGLVVAADTLGGESEFATWLATSPVHTIRIDVAPADLAALRTHPRRDVPATVVIDGGTRGPVAVHLKGSTGSFQPVDRKPGLTLDFARYAAGQSWHGRRKLHLNNSVEDPSELCEQLGAELFRAAGVPAPEVSHARVTLNGRALGLHVLVAGYDAAALGEWFGRGDGMVYDRDAGGAAASAPLARRLGAVAGEPDPGRRWERLAAVVDRERWLSFLALEVLIGHRDGYGLARNNFRVYDDPASGRLVFLPHGLDQLWGNPELPWQPHFAGTVAAWTLAAPAGRAAYEDRFRQLLATVGDPARLVRRVQELSTTLAGAVDRSEATTLRAAAADLADRIARRGTSLRGQLSAAPPAGLEFAEGVARLDGWEPAPLAGAATIDTPVDATGHPGLRVRADSPGSAAWRVRRTLAPGRYVFEGRVMTDGVIPLPYGKRQGAALRVGGGRAESAGLTGTRGWTLVRCPFEVPPGETEGEFLCELRAAAGEARFDRESLRLRRQE